MPQLPVGFVPDNPEAPAGFVPDSAPNPAGQETKWSAGRALRAIESYLPSTRTAFRVGGQIIGGTGGALATGSPAGAVIGGGLGAAAGDSAYQAISRMTPDIRAIVESALGGSAGEAVGPIIGRLAGTGAQLETESLLAPRSMGEKAQLRGVSEQLSKEIPIRPTGPAIKTALSQMKDQAGKEVEQAYLNANVGPIDTGPIKAAMIAERDAQIRSVAGQSTPGSAPILNTYNRIIDWLDRNPRVTVDQMRQDKQLWDSLVNYRKASNNMTANEGVYQSAADKFRGVLNSISEIGRANQVFHRINMADQLFANRETSAVSKAAVPGLGDMLAGTFGAGVGGNVAGPYGALIGAPTSVVAKRILTSPGFQSLSIGVQRAVADALGRGDVALAVRILGGTGIQQALQPGTTVTVSVLPK